MLHVRPVCSDHRLALRISQCSVIELITNNREPQPGFEAVYLLMPTSHNVDRVIKDFSGGAQQYAAGHIFFIEGIAVITDKSVAALMRIRQGWRSRCFNACLLLQPSRSLGGYENYS
jgi:Sec1 family